MPITSTPTSTTIQGINGSDPIFDDPIARSINFNDSYTTPSINRTIGQSVLWGTPAYHHVQSAFQSTPTGSPWYGSGFQSASPHLPMTTLAVSPANYIAAGLHASQDSQSQASSVTTVRTLSSDAFGNPFRDLRTAAAYRQAELEQAFTSCGLVWPFIPVDQPTAMLPFTVHNPLVTDLNTKLHHLVARVQHYFNARSHRRGNPINFDRLGDRAYEGGRCDIFQQQAASLLEVLKDIDLLGVICAIAASNFAITVDQVSTQIPRQKLTAILENLAYNSRMLNGTVTPLSVVQHEYIRCTPANSVLTVTAMQLVSLTTVFLKAISGFLQPATLQAITGSVTSGLRRRLDPTLMEIVRLLMMYEDTEERESLRRKYIKEQLGRPISTHSVHQALQEWIERKQAYAYILGQPAY